MKVYIYPADLEGCGYYRLIWPSIVLRAAGHDVKIVSPRHPNRVVGTPDGAGNLVSINAPSDADVMVFQRVASKMMLQAIPIWRANGIAVVTDIDDDFARVHQANPAWLALHPTSGGNTDEYDWNTARRVAQAATMVTVSTDALLRRYASPERGVILHNCIPAKALEIPHVEQPNAIGWGGTVRSHPDDPQVTGSSMARLQREGFKFTIVGPARKVKETFNLDDEPIATGTVPLHRWIHELGRLAVGIAPLNDTAFNEAKSWLKMLEYAAAGVPCVASPRAEYRKLHARGVGLLADNPRDWYRHSKKLLTDDVRRYELSEAGRAAVASLTIEDNAWRWWEAWERALVIQRGMFPAQRTTRTQV
jgi:hypothetical protein